MQPEIIEPIIAEHLTAEELIVLRDLMKRWIYSSWPCCDGSGAASDAIVTLESIERDAKKGKQRRCPTSEEIQENIASGKYVSSW
jgi:hypothetical protein